MKEECVGDNMKRIVGVVVCVIMCLMLSGCFNKSPKIVLEQDNFMVEVNDQYFRIANLSPFIKVSDSKGNNIPFSELSIKGDYDLEVIGKYQLSITATSDGGSTVEMINLNVVDTTKPVFSFVDDEILIYNGTKFNPDPIMNLIFAVDNYEGNVTDRVTYSGEVNANEVGTYIVDYTVSDTSGNTNKISVTYRVTNSMDEFVDYIYKRAIDFYWGKYFIVDKTSKVLNYDKAVYYMFTNNGQAQFERACGLRDNYDNTQSGIILTKVADDIYMYPQDKIIVNNYINTSFKVAYRRGIYLQFYAIAHYSNGIKPVLDLDGLFYLKRVDGKWYVDEFALPN